MVMTGLLTVPYVIGKLTGAGALGGFTLAIDEVLAATALEHDLTLATSGISPLSESPF
jgi:predicted nucleic acid-binding protein